MDKSQKAIVAGRVGFGVRLELIYKGSLHEFNMTKFLQKIKKPKRLVILVQSEFDHSFGFFVNKNPTNSQSSIMTQKKKNS